MLALVFSVTLINTYMWFGGQGYCAFDFALHESEREIEKLKIVLRPRYNPDETATGADELPDSVLELPGIGGARASWAARASIEADCGITGFDMIAATGIVDGRPTDLLKKGLIEIETYSPLPIGMGGK